jgi:cytochrome bd ubiquinol oxidase subunit I
VSAHKTDGMYRVDFDALLLSRMQFAFTIAFHILFPAFTIGLAAYLAVLEGLWLWTKREAFKTLYLFWVKIFALSFGMGVVSGVVLSYQFGTNWSEFIRLTGGVIGPLMAFEVLTAFFLEASFLGVMLFGWKKVTASFHRYSAGRDRHDHFGLLDPVGQQLDADAPGL